MRHERAIPMALAANDFEIRSTSGGHQFIGYAAIFGAESAPLPYIESVQPGAFARSLASPPNGRQTFLVDHDPTKLLSSTRAQPDGPSRLRLSEDSKGLLTDSEWPDTSYARDVRELADMGELGGMSFEFTPVGAKGAPFSSDKKRRNLREVKVYHVTVLTGKVPAYDSTTAGFRALADELKADFEDVATLFDAVREGRTLTDAEWHLLGKAAATVAPTGAPRWSSAADDASSAAYVLATITGLLGNETDDATQAGYLKTAAAAMQSFIAAESDEIGTPADQEESGYPSMARALAGWPELKLAHMPGRQKVAQDWPELKTPPADRS